MAGVLFFSTLFFCPTFDLVKRFSVQSLDVTFGGSDRFVAYSYWDYGG